MHFFNVFVFSRIRGRVRVPPPPPVAPNAVLPVAARKGF